MEQYIYQGTRKLRRGYTTGTCAAAAAGAAARMLLTGTAVPEISVRLPNGESLTLPVTDARGSETEASCAVVKDSGDDPDVTNGVAVYARVSRIPEGVTITGGVGIGIVTKAGLDQPVGAYAINSVPRRMIEAAVRSAAQALDADGGFAVEIYVPEGAELAKKTYNPRMGIEGGISIIGTSGIVEPMSTAALIDTIRTEASMRKAAGEQIPQSFTGLLEAAILRSSGRIPDALQSFRTQGQQALMPGAGMIPEYYLMLDLYLKQQRYTDFMRALTPFMIEVFIAAIRKQFQHDVTQYMIYCSRKWDENKLVLTQMTGKFNETYTFHTKPKPGKAGGFVTTAHLSNFMENMSVAKSHSHLILDTLKLRQSAEDKLRNWANYTLQYASAEDFRRACALTAEELLAMLRTYVRNYTDIVLSDEFLASYDKINEKLKSML